MEFALKQGRVLVLDAAEAKERWESASFWNEMEYMLQSNRMHFSKAVVLADAVVGEIMWHPEEAYDGRAVSIIYYLDRSELVLIGQKTRHDHWEKQLRSLISDEDDLSPVRFFIRLLDELLKDDIKHLQRRLLPDGRGDPVRGEDGSDRINGQISQNITQQELSISTDDGYERYTCRKCQ